MILKGKVKANSRHIQSNPKCICYPFGKHAVVDWILIDSKFSQHFNGKMMFVCFFTWKYIEVNIIAKRVRFMFMLCSIYAAKNLWGASLSLNELIRYHYINHCSVHLPLWTSSLILDTMRFSFLSMNMSDYSKSILRSLWAPLCQSNARKQDSCFRNEQKYVSIQSGLSEMIQNKLA